MKELDKALGIALKGKEAERALARFRLQMKAWAEGRAWRALGSQRLPLRKVALPPVAPLVLDFGLGDFERTGLIEYWIANEMKAGYCGKYLFVFNGQTCPLHRHRKKHETFFIVKGRVAMTYGGRRFEMGEGEVLPVQRWKLHSFTGIGPALLLEVSMPCEVDDNYFENPAIPIGGNYQRKVQHGKSRRLSG